MRAPFETSFGVDKAWTDYNGHMNMGYYLVALDNKATDGFFNHLGIGLAYIEAEKKSLFTVTSCIDYIQEAFAGDTLEVATRLIAFDQKRVLYVHQLYQAGSGAHIANNECLSLHVDMTTRRSAPFPPEVLAKIAEYQRADAECGPIAKFTQRLALRR
ncbi:MAG: hypothetical protein FJX47_16645 [Alphaproteobacteria bacterium]|nr:hypothetical protein [Alphaproteobacteria bacterium]